MRSCPRCRTPLSPIEYEGVQIDRCIQCNGEWLDAGELKHIVDTREKQWDPKDLAAMRQRRIQRVALWGPRKTLSCPDCSLAMEPVNYGGDTGIIIEHCRQCGGNWLDAGELEKVQQVVEAWDRSLTGDLRRYASRLHGAEQVEHTLARTDARQTRDPAVSAWLYNILDV